MAISKTAVAESVEAASQASRAVAAETGYDSNVEDFESDDSKPYADRSIKEIAAVTPVVASAGAASDDRYKVPECKHGSKAFHAPFITQRHDLTCFAYMCFLAGVPVRSDVTSVSELRDSQKDALADAKDFKVHLMSYGKDDPRNHVELIKQAAPNFHSYIQPVGGLGYYDRVVSVTTMQHFFQTNSEWYLYHFYSNAASTTAVDDDNTGSFGDVFHSAVDPSPDPVQQQTPTQQFPQAPRPVSSVPTSYVPEARRGPPSVVDDGAEGGGSNVTGGVVRSRRRRIKTVATGPSTVVSKGYNVSGAIMFNNFDEMFQDSISRDYAQEIIEELFAAWLLPTDQPDTMKFAEDLLVSFLIATTASNKANYDKSFVVPVKPTRGSDAAELEVNFSELSRLLSYTHNLTRRQFSRGIADDQRAFLMREENNHLRPTIATRIGCEASLAHLGFDGSTHCSNLTTREQTFTRTLEARNLFERDDVVAQGATDRLMQGFSGGSRSVAPR